MNPRWISALGLFAAMLVGGCRESAPPAADSPPPATATASSTPMSATAGNQAGTLIVTDTSGTAVWTLRVDGSHVEISGPDGARIVGERRGDKRRYRRESDGAALAEVKFSDSGFKLRSPDSQLLWKVKLSDDKIKVSDNEENQNPWVLKTGYDDKAKVLDPSESEIGAVRFQAERIKVKDAAGDERFLIDTTRRSAGFGVLLMTAIPEQQRGILMAELLASGR
ncbi:MAG: hypothetical protein ACT4NL_08510 [Pseudomarimonas sp.]